MKCCQSTLLASFIQAVGIKSSCWSETSCKIVEHTQKVSDGVVQLSDCTLITKCINDSGRRKFSVPDVLINYQYLIPPSSGLKSQPVGSHFVLKIRLVVHHISKTILILKRNRVQIAIQYIPIMLQGRVPIIKMEI